ncbi:uncharacterized protein H6S33_001075 [Morchella sextelata]|uniref:uncharacterized protein n=1 Tax=Morchella sextelata TaxID=1174677 RepID=UPI001D057699|nr:uncharacterized protein H6S33_001075 [Morchella sextelata]KAH0608847.1 hypothetical protein H6S33_001075 [Morchella sextelata]
MSAMLAPMLGAMVICRGIARFIGYPPSLDPTFTNAPLLHTFSATLDACAQSHTLWHLTPTDVATIFAPLLDYASRTSTTTTSYLAQLHPTDIAHTQTHLTFATAHTLTTDLDTLTRAHNPWARWFGLILYTQTLAHHGHPRHLHGTHPNDANWDANVGAYEIPLLLAGRLGEEIASENFFTACQTLHGHIIGYSAFKRSFLRLSALIPAPSLPLSPPPAADPFLSPHWTIASELRGRGAFPLSPRMALLLAGSTEESTNTNWLNRGRYESAPLKGLDGRWEGCGGGVGVRCVS